MPRVAFFSSFNKKEITKERLIEIEVLGMDLSTNLDARNVSKGYLILMKYNEYMKQFYE